MQFVLATVSIAFLLSLACALFAWSVLNLGHQVVLILFALASANVLTGGTQRLSKIAYRVATACSALRSLYYLPQEQIDDFLRSYELFDQERVGDGNEANKIVNYYAVLNHLCSIGEVEKMYIPPILDPERSIIENQNLFEQKICADLNINPEFNVLDVGCGRGRVLAHVAQTTGARELHGLNIDETQLSNAKRYAKEQGFNHLHYHHGNFNDPLPFPDQSFDALYQIQVLTYAKDKKALFSEMFRVMKPGAKLSFLDWVKTDAYDASNKKHQDILKAVKPLIGAVDTPSGEELKSVLEEVGFNVTFSADISKNGHQADLIQSADTFFNIVTNLVNFLVLVKLLPAHFQVLLDRFIKDGDKFIEGDRMGLFTTSYQTIAQKPF